MKVWKVPSAWVMMVLCVDRYTYLCGSTARSNVCAQVMEVFGEMVAAGCERTVITYSSLISACEKAGQWERALSLFEGMHQDGCRPNVITYNSLITACAQGGGAGGGGGARVMQGGLVQGYGMVSEDATWAAGVAERSGTTWWEERGEVCLQGEQQRAYSSRAFTCPMQAPNGSEPARYSSRCNSR